MEYMTSKAKEYFLAVLRREKNVHTFIKMITVSFGRKIEMTVDLGGWRKKRKI